MKQSNAGKPDTSKHSKQAAMLALKRARDRRAQQAMRNRAKAEIAALQEQVLHLQERLRGQDSMCSRDLSRSVRENDQTRQKVGDSQFHPLSAQPQLHHWSQAYKWTNSRVRLSLDQSILLAFFSPKATPSLPPVERRSPPDSQDLYSSVSLPSQPDHLRLPLQIPPLNPSDRIVQPFVQKMREDLSDPQSPLSTMSPSAIQANISRVVSDIISTYSEFDTLAKRVACIMSSTSALTVCHSPAVSAS
jgi:hypothetical protein